VYSGDVIDRFEDAKATRIEIGLDVAALARQLGEAERALPPRLRRSAGPARFCALRSRYLALHAPPVLCFVVSDRAGDPSHFT
jgi:hypothetical protein